jgi:intraflagellar transport protein 81
VKENDPEDTNKKIMEGLMKIQFQPKDESVDIGTLRRGLVRGEKKIIHPILQWIFENKDLIKKLAYLAK